jgi:hypothetical protein
MKTRLKLKRARLIVMAVFMLLLTGVCPVLAEEKPAAAMQPDAKASAATAAEEEKPTADLTVSALNLYYSKGVASSRHSVVIQPSMTVGYKGFSVCLWGNLDTNPYPLSNPNGKNVGNWTETDVTLAYNKTFGIVNTGLSYGYNGNANAAVPTADGRDQHDLGMTLGLTTLLNPTLNVYYMFDNSQRWYFMFGVGHTVELSKMISVKLGATAAYMASDVKPTDPDAGATRNKSDSSGNSLPERYNNFLDGVVSLSLPVKVTKYFTVTPAIAYAFPLGEDAKNYMKTNSFTDASMRFSDKPGTFIVGGISASLSF